MSLGRSPACEDAFRSTTTFCQGQLSPTSIYSLLHREAHRIFPDEAFADLFCDVGRQSVPPQIVAVVMVLQRLEGLSDREAVDRFSFDLRWKYAAGGLEFNYPGFVHTVLVGMRARLRRSERPNRIFEAALEVAQQAGLVGRKRALDSTPLYDAVATQDTVTLIRSAIRALLRVAGKDLAPELRGCLKRDDDYEAAGKPACDWDDKEAREALVDALARDAHALLAELNDREVSPEVSQAATLLATVVGQDVEQDGEEGGGGGRFRIARRVAKDRVISTVDPEARHGHKSSARGFDGYKGHVAMDPDSEIITATDATPGNAADGSVAATLLADVLDGAPSRADEGQESGPPSPEQLPAGSTTESDAAAGERGAEPRAEVYGDASYGTAAIVDSLEAAGIEANVKMQGPSAPAGMFSKDDFHVDLDAQTVTCPAQIVVPIRKRGDGGLATFGVVCAACPLRSRCTNTKSLQGRSVQLHPREATVQRTRKRQSCPSWKARYRATRPKVERKIGHLMSRRHGGRRARVRGRERVRNDFSLLAAAQNLRRLAALGVHHDGTAWKR